MNNGHTHVLHTKDGQSITGTEDHLKKIKADGDVLLKIGESYNGQEATPVAVETPITNAETIARQHKPLDRKPKEVKETKKKTPKS